MPDLKLSIDFKVEEANLSILQYFLFSILFVKSSCSFFIIFATKL